jgi:hypothetical protein
MSVKDEVKPEKREYTEPKLEFVEPKLTKHGDVTKITAGNGFFGEFSPPAGEPEEPVG